MATALQLSHFPLTPPSARPLSTPEPWDLRARPLGDTLRNLEIKVYSDREVRWYMSDRVAETYPDQFWRKQPIIRTEDGLVNLAATFYLVYLICTVIAIVAIFVAFASRGTIIAPALVSATAAFGFRMITRSIEKTEGDMARRWVRTPYNEFARHVPVEIDKLVTKLRFAIPDVRIEVDRCLEGDFVVDPVLWAVLGDERYCVAIWD